MLIAYLRNEAHLLVYYDNVLCNILEIFSYFHNKGQRKISMKMSLVTAFLQPWCWEVMPRHG